MKYSEKDINKILDTVDKYLTDINVSKVKRKAVYGEIRSTLELENIKLEIRRKKRMKKLGKAAAIAKANKQKLSILQANYEATGTEYVCGDGKVVDVVKQKKPINRYNVTAAEIQKELKEERQLAWSKIEFIDWFLHRFPVCSSYTVKEIMNIANDAGIRVI